jgi:hypothetical protein
MKLEARVDTPKYEVRVLYINFPTEIVKSIKPPATFTEFWSLEDKVA